MAIELEPEQKLRFGSFNPLQPLVIQTAEIEGLEDYKGRFVFRRQTIGDHLKIGVNMAKRRENVPLDTLTDNIVFVLATFDVVCTEKPANLTFEDLFDVAPLFKLHDRYVEWLEFFRLKVQSGKEAIGTAGQF